LPQSLESKGFFFINPKGGKSTLAITKERKREMIDQYNQWLKKSQAMIMTEYTGLPMAQLDNLRGKLREAGGEFHIVKNTLGKRAFEEAGLSMPEDYFEGSTAIGFAFEDAPAAAKALTDFARTTEFLKIKGGFLGDRAITPVDVKALADLPPLDIIRAQLLGVLMAPASRLARTLAEPGRMIAAVIKAYAERDSVQESAPEAGA
jgi:large subunit ribosomal protein L10